MNAESIYLRGGPYEGCTYDCSVDLNCLDHVVICGEIYIVLDDYEKTANGYDRIATHSNEKERF